MKEFPVSLRKDFSIFKALNTPRKVQDFIARVPLNFEQGGETCRSPLGVLKHRRAHCMEGGMLAAAIFWYHGRPPLLLDLVTIGKDDDHVVALFKEDGYWGAVSKTNHAVLRYRDPIYRDVRELAMSYFHEYFLDDGMKTVRKYSKPFDLRVFGSDWLITEKDLFNIADALDRSPHLKAVTKKQIRTLRPADPVERRAGKLVEWKRRP